MSLPILCDEYPDAIVLLALQTVILSLGISDVANNWWSACWLLWWKASHGLRCSLMVLGYIPVSLGSWSIYLWLFLFTRILLGLAEGVALPTSQAWTTWCWGIYLCNIIPFDYFISNFFPTKTYCCLAVGISAEIYLSVCIGPFITGGFLAQRDLVLWVLQWLAFSLAMPLGYFFPQLSCHELESLDLLWYLDYSDFCGCWCGYRLYLAHQVNMHRYQHMNWSI